MGSMNASVLWIDGDQLYCFTQLMNPGPGVLFASRDSEARLRDRVAEIDGIQESMTAAIAVQDGRERAERLKPYVVSDVFPAQQSSLEELGRSGPSAAPTIIGMLDDPTFADEASEFGERAALKGVSLQLGILRLGLLQDGDVGVGVSPQRQKILICGAGFVPGGGVREPSSALARPRPRCDKGRTREFTTKVLWSSTL